MGLPEVRFGAQPDAEVSHGSSGHWNALGWSHLSGTPRTGLPARPADFNNGAEGEKTSARARTPMSGNWAAGRPPRVLQRIQAAPPTEPAFGHGPPHPELVTGGSVSARDTAAAACGEDCPWAPRRKLRGDGLGWRPFMAGSSKTGASGSFLCLHPVYTSVSVKTQPPCYDVCAFYKHVTLQCETSFRREHRGPVPTALQRAPSPPAFSPRPVHSQAPAFLLSLGIATPCEGQGARIASSAPVGWLFLHLWGCFFTYTSRSALT